MRQGKCSSDPSEPGNTRHHSEKGAGGPPPGSHMLVSVQLGEVRAGDDALTAVRWRGNDPLGHKAPRVAVSCQACAVITSG